MRIWTALLSAFLHSCASGLVPNLFVADSHVEVDAADALIPLDQGALDTRVTDNRVGDTQTQVVPSSDVSSEPRVDSATVADVAADAPVSLDQGVIDAGVGIWHADCDCDDYSTNGAVQFQGARPDIYPASCGTAPRSCAGLNPWTLRAPSQGLDCDDTSFQVNPGNQIGLAIPRGGNSYDYDCDGTSEVTVGSSCSTNCIGLPMTACGAFATNCWPSLPTACGVGYTYQTTCAWSNNGCAAVTTSMTPPCH